MLSLTAGDDNEYLDDVEILAAGYSYRSQVTNFRQDIDASIEMWERVVYQTSDEDPKLIARPSSFHWDLRHELRRFPPTSLAI